MNAVAVAPAGAANELAAAGASLTAAGGSLAALSAAGGLQAAQLQGLQQSITQAVTAAVTQAMSAQLQPITAQLAQQGAQLAQQGTQLAQQGAQLAQQGAQLAQQGTQLASLMTLASKTHNATCGEGGIRPYVPVPNAAGVLAPPGEQPVLNRAALLDLNAPRSVAWCAHYGAPVGGTLAARRALIASQLGLAPGVIS
jgi:hypothetical protein